MKNETQTPQPENIQPSSPIDDQPRQISRGAKVALAAGITGAALLGNAMEADTPSKDEPAAHVAYEDVDAGPDVFSPVVTAPTENYQPGRAEEVISQQSSEEPGGMSPTEYGTPVSENESTPTNPDYVEGSASTGTNEGISNHPQSNEARTEFSDETAGPTQEPLPEDPGTPPLEVEISGVEAGQEYLNNIAADLTKVGSAEKVSYIHGSMFKVAEEYQQQYGITTIYHPVVTGKDTLGYLRVNSETGQVTGGVIDARHGEIVVAQGETDENRFTTLHRQFVDNDPVNKSGGEDYYRITADDEQETFVGQGTGLSERKGGGEDAENTEGEVEYDKFPSAPANESDGASQEGEVEYDKFSDSGK